jgi:hypothetical protein
LSQGRLESQTPRTSQAYTANNFDQLFPQPPYHLPRAELRRAPCHRNFLVRSSLSVAALTPLFMPAEKTKLASPARYDDWEAVHREFDLAPDYILLGLFYLTSHPRPVGEAIEQYRRKLDANPFVTG